MNLRLTPLSIDRYAEEVLPRTFGLWAHGRSFEQYVEHTRALAESAYGRRYFRTFGLLDGSERTVSSFKRYERKARVGAIALRCVGLGGIFTAEEQRGKGFASAMIGLALDRARSEGFDFAFLFSDIHPHFYQQIGFQSLPSRSISFRADSLDDRRIAVEPAGESDWSAMRACFASCEAARDFSLVRTPLTWEWMRTRIKQRSAEISSQPVRLLVRESRALGAYLFARREPLHDALIVDEVAYAHEGARELIPPLLRNAAGDLRRIAGWLPPFPVRDTLPRGSVRKRAQAIWMIAPLTQGGERFARAAEAASPADGVWEFDHV